MRQLVLIRHGESEWNRQNRFTGWTDVDLTEEGVLQAHKAGTLLKQNGFTFDLGFTSVLKRSIKTIDIVLEEVDRLWIPVTKSWRLNERFYGALQGLNKAEITMQYGEAQVQKWRRDPNEEPPAITTSDERYPGFDDRYQDLTNDELPLTENIGDTMKRVLPIWNNAIVPAIQDNKKVIVCAHGNSLRALIKYIDNLNDDEVTQLEIPTAQPWIYELDDNMNRIRHYYLT